MKSICGADCGACNYGKDQGCKGCRESQGCPFGKQCFIFRYIKTGGMEHYDLLKKQLIEEFNALNIPGLPDLHELYAMNGSYVHIAYPLPNGEAVRLLDDNQIYLCNQVACAFHDGEIGRCYGVVAGMDFLLVSEYGANGTDPELILYKKR